MDEITFLAKRVKLTFALEFTGPSENLSLHQQKQNHAVNNMVYNNFHGYLKLKGQIPWTCFSQKQLQRWLY